FIDMSSTKNQRAVETRMREALEADRARVQIGRISRFGLLEMSRQRLRPSLDDLTTEVCPRCSGQGRIRDARSLALAILRVMEEEALKDRSSLIQALVPISIAAYLLNEKRPEVTEIERRTGARLMVVPNAHMETPHYEVTRLRSDQVQDEDLTPSYELAEAGAKPMETISAREAPAPSRQAVVQAIRPATPAPLPRAELEPADAPEVTQRAAASNPTPTGRATTPPARPSLLRRIVASLFGPDTAPVAPEQPPETTGGSADGESATGNRGGRGRGRGRGRGDRREGTRAESDGGRTASGRADAGQADSGRTRGDAGTADSSDGERDGRRRGRGRSRGEGRAGEGRAGEGRAGEGRSSENRGAELGGADDRATDAGDHGENREDTGLASTEAGTRGESRRGRRGGRRPAREDAREEVREQDGLEAAMTGDSDDTGVADDGSRGDGEPSSGGRRRRSRGRATSSGSTPSDAGGDDLGAFEGAVDPSSRRPTAEALAASKRLPRRDRSLLDDGGARTAASAPAGQSAAATPQVPTDADLPEIVGAEIVVAEAGAATTAIPDVSLTNTGAAGVETAETGSIELAVESTAAADQTAAPTEAETVVETAVIAPPAADAESIESLSI
ncbi:MAG: ribonuclease E/G, partial [Gammaproteobacteria bacterium]